MPQRNQSSNMYVNMYIYAGYVNENNYYPNVCAKRCFVGAFNISKLLRYFSIFI